MKTVTMNDWRNLAFLNGVEREDIPLLRAYKRWIYYSYDQAYPYEYIRMSKSGSLYCNFGFVPLATRRLHELGYNVIYDYRIHKIDEIKSNIILYGYQNLAVAQWLRNNKLGLIKAPTGSGKTIIGCQCINMSRVRTIILIHTKDLIRQWINSLVKFGYDEDNIGTLGDNKKDIVDKDIIVATYQSAHKYIHALNGLGIGLVIFDEAHHVPAKTFRKTARMLKAMFRLGLTATPDRLDGFMEMVFAYTDNIVSDIKMRDLIDQKYISDVKFYKIDCYERAATEIRTGKDGLEHSRQLKQISAFSEHKREILANILKVLQEKNKEIILFCDRVPVANEFCKQYEGIILKATMSAERREYELSRFGVDSNLLVVAKLAQEGVDLPECDCIINFNAFKSPITFAQRTGRALRKAEGKQYAEVYSFVLEDTLEVKWYKYAFREFKKEGFETLQYF